MVCPHDNSAADPAAFFHSRRGVLAALGCAAVLSATRPVAATDISADDERFMRLAIDEARQGDFPFGTVIVHDRHVLARGRNLGRAMTRPRMAK
jgi:tRNA(adenine34) deaminase